MLSLLRSFLWVQLVLITSMVVCEGISYICRFLAPTFSAAGLCTFFTVNVSQTLAKRNWEFLVSLNGFSNRNRAKFLFC